MTTTPPSHIMPITVIESQHATLWLELCELRRYVAELEAECERLRRVVVESEGGAGE